MIAHGRYLIFYSLIESDVQVERVLHSARDIARLFDSDNLDRQPQ